MPLIMFLYVILAGLVVASGAVGAIPVGAAYLLAIGVGAVALLEHAAARL